MLKFQKRQFGLQSRQLRLFGRYGGRVVLFLCHAFFSGFYELCCSVEDAVFTQCCMFLHILGEGLPLSCFSLRSQLHGDFSLGTRLLLLAQLDLQVFQFLDFGNSDGLLRFSPLLRFVQFTLVSLVKQLGSYLQILLGKSRSCFRDLSLILFFFFLHKSFQFFVSSLFLGHESRLQLSGLLPGSFRFVALDFGQLTEVLLFLASSLHLRFNVLHFLDVHGSLASMFYSMSYFHFLFMQSSFSSEGLSLRRDHRLLLLQLLTRLGLCGRTLLSFQATTTLMADHGFTQGFLLLHLVFVAFLCLLDFLLELQLHLINVFLYLSQLASSLGHELVQVGNMIDEHFHANIKLNIDCIHVFKMPIHGYALSFCDT